MELAVCTKEELFCGSTDEEVGAPSNLPPYWAGEMGPRLKHSLRNVRTGVGIPKFHTNTGRAW